MNIDTERICRKCQSIKPLDDFYVTRGKRNNKCVECCRKAVRERYPLVRKQRLQYQKNMRLISEEYRARSKINTDKNYQSIKGRSKSIWRTASRSKTANTKPFTLTVDHIVEGLERGTCAVTGIRFVFERNNVTQNHPFAPSLDKIDPNGPYSNENTRMVIWQYNTFKGQISDLEVYFIARAIVDRFEKP